MNFSLALYPIPVQYVVMPAPVPKIEFTCVICGSPFYRIASRLRTPRHGSPKYCSLKCSHQRKQLNEVRNCELCDKEFYIAPWEKRANRRWCSMDCYLKSIHTRWDRRELKIRLLEKRKIVLKVRSLGPCWLWQGAVSGKYGKMYVDGDYIGIHKISAWVFLKSERALQKGREVNVCHKCDVRTCFRPSHLMVGTPKINTQDMVSKGRHASQIKTHCKYGHPFSGSNLRWTKSQSGRMSRMCRICRNARSWERAHGIKRMH